MRTQETEGASRPTPKMRAPLMTMTLFAVAVMPSCFAAQAGPAQPVKLKAGTWYKIVNQSSGLCVDAEGWNTTDGTIVQQYACGEAQNNQQWRFVPQEGGVYAVFNRNAPHLALNVKTSDDTGVQLWTYGGGTNEQWIPVPLGGDLYKLVGVRGHQCLQVTGASKSNNAHMEVGPCTGAASQAFSVTPS